MLPDLHFSKNTPAQGRPTRAPIKDLQDRTARLNQNFRGAKAQEVLAATLTDASLGRIAVVSSFGAESVVLLHMAAQIDRGVPVLFLDTQMLFYETLTYQVDMTEKLGLWNVRVIRADEHEVTARDPLGTLHQSDPDGCCALRKTRPLQKALEGFDGWVTGRKRYQSGARQALDHFELDEATGRLKVNPLAHWDAGDAGAYMVRHGLPRHPLVGQGYPSIGCAPCTSPVAEGEDPRSGRWRGLQKTECGIHFADSKPQQKGKAA